MAAFEALYSECMREAEQRASDYPLSLEVFSVLEDVILGGCLASLTFLSVAGCTVYLRTGMPAAREMTVGASVHMVAAARAAKRRGWTDEKIQAAQNDEVMP
jgi:hypothetical protein